MKNKAINALIEMGVAANTIGFRYIVDAMCVMSEEPDFIHGKTTALYHCIAKRNDSSAAGVERVIRNAFSSVLKLGSNTVAVDKYLTRSNTSSGNLLSVLYLRLTQEE